MKGVQSLCLDLLLLSPLGMSPSLTAENPNLDPAWNWRNEQPIELFYSVSGEKPTRVTAKVPFFTDGNRLCSEPYRDMHPEDGWQLVHRDFGTPELGPAFPLLTLYNKYSGIFRIMLYNAMNRAESFYLGELSFVDGGVHPGNAVACFTFPNTENCSIKDYNPRDKQISMCNMSMAGDWAIFDYNVIGYDPALEEKDPVLLFRIIGVTKSEIKMEGQGELDLMQRLSSRDAYASGSSPSAAGTIAMAANNSFMHYRSVANWQEELASGKFKDKPWFEGVKQLMGTPLMSYFPAVMALGGLVETFFGGEHVASPWEPLAFNGQFNFKMDGAIETKVHLWAHNFFLNPGALSLRAQRPVQKIHWGILNFPSIPSVRTFPAPGDPRGFAGAWHLQMDRDPGILFNPYSGMEVTSVKVAFKKKELDVADLSNFAAAAEAMQKEKWRSTLVTPYMDLGTAMATPVACANPLDLILYLQWEIKFRIVGPTKFYDRERVMIKTTRWEGHRY